MKLAQSRINRPDIMKIKKMCPLPKTPWEMYVVVGGGCLLSQLGKRLGDP